jgi:hypothetical protein
MDEECPSCGALVEVEVWEEGECDRCGNRYWWEEMFDEDEDANTGPIIMWE